MVELLVYQTPFSTHSRRVTLPRRPSPRHSGVSTCPGCTHVCPTDSWGVQESSLPVKGSRKISWMVRRLNRSVNQSVVSSSIQSIQHYHILLLKLKIPSSPTSVSEPLLPVTQDSHNHGPLLVPVVPSHKWLRVGLPSFGLTRTFTSRRDPDPVPLDPRLGPVLRRGGTRVVSCCRQGLLPQL